MKVLTEHEKLTRLKIPHPDSAHIPKIVRNESPLNSLELIHRTSLRVNIKKTTVNNIAIRALTALSTSFHVIN